MTDRLIVARSVPLLDIEIERSGDGRTVTALAAVFDADYPVIDSEGDYDETIDRAAFNRTLTHGIGRTQVLFNHGRNLAGEPSDRYSMPLGVPVEVRPEATGLLTVTRYAKTDLADEVLELIRAGAIRGQSFRGAAYRSARSFNPATGRTRITRLELGLADYGPTPFPVNDAAAILAVRSLTLEDHPVVTPTSTPDVDSQAGPGEATAHIDEQPAPEAPAFDPGADPLTLAAANRRRR